MANGQPPKKEPKPCDPNLPLRNYLIKLAIDDDIRTEINADKDRAARKKAIEKHTSTAPLSPLDPADVEALLDRDPDELIDLLRCNQQNT